MKLNNKGMTLVELIISIALLSVIIGFLYKILLDVKYENDDAGFAINNQVNRSEIIKTIQYDLEALGTKNITCLPSMCTFEFNGDKNGSIVRNNTHLSYRNSEGYLKKWNIKDDNYKWGTFSLEAIANDYWKITIPVISLDDNNDSSIDDIILFTKYKEIQKVYPYLNDSIHANTTLVETVPYFNVVAIDENTNLYQTEDDYGTSYYFRGAALNNYVSFANFYWRIVRINGDGSIRLIYDGTSAVTNGVEHVATINKVAYNSIYNNIKYAGYTYDGGINSKIKNNIDNWYASNLENNYGSYIADTKFCNDKTVSSTGKVTVYYNGYSRLITNKKPSLLCSQDDSYTVDDTVSGNGDLTYPVALITADEISMAGGVRGIDNSKFFLYSGEPYWTMTPCDFSGSLLSFFTGNGGSGNKVSIYLNNIGATSLSVRPVINLKSDVRASGSGTVSDPYVIQPYE